MPAEYNIPVNYKEGIYGLKEPWETGREVLRLDYQETGEILRYGVPGYEYGSKITLYSVPKDELEETLKAYYNANGHLTKITANVKGKDKLLYIYYENMEHARSEIKNFAIENADIIIRKICMCKEKVSRLFTECFNDGEYLDFHAKIGTEEQKNKVKEKYPDSKYAVDNCGNYPPEIIYGDNDKLKVMGLCADNDEMDFFQYACGIMEELIGEKAAGQLNKAEDFQFICSGYD